MSDQFETAAAVRDLAAALVAHDADPALDAEVAATARALAVRLRACARSDSLARLRALDRDDDANGFLPMVLERPVGGAANPTAVPQLVRRDGDNAVSSEVVFDEMFQGGIGRVHGGILAGMFDDLTGHLTTLLRTPAVTGRLNISYRRPTPVGVPIAFRAWVTKHEGRRISVSAECRHGDTVTATAEALYVVVQESYRNHYAGSPGDPL